MDIRAATAWLCRTRIHNLEIKANTELQERDRLQTGRVSGCGPTVVSNRARLRACARAAQRAPQNSQTIDWRNFMTARALVVLIAPLLVVSGCAATIHGTVQLVDSRQQPLPNESPKGAVVNMINTTVAVDQASSSATVDEKGEFESPKGSIKPGLYKVEASRIGYETQTETVEIGSFFGKKVEFKLPKIQETKRKSIKGSATDEDKIINPGEVNIQPPAM
jgi:hypothetical protein